MRQVVQNLKNGKLSVIKAPDPMARPGHVLIANARSLISAGTEKMAMELARMSLLGKARERPDQVRRVIEKLKNEGFFSTIAQVLQRLDEPMTMGYSSAGVVIACGEGVQDLKPGDRAASNGPHAGVVCVPRNLCARVPDAVSFDHAAFTVLGAIALQGVRLSRTGLGDTALVIGLGLVGQITVALLKAAGCRVIGTDLDPAKCALAEKMGAHSRAGLGASDVAAMTGGLGADAVLITASTDSDQPVALAGEAVRKKGRVVAVGAVGLDLPRRPYYFKEAEFVVSCSYGPGRYDYAYEDAGRDYPPAYVRWTEQRNMQAVLDLMAAGRLDVSPLITHRFKIEDAQKAYRIIETAGEPYLAMLLEYPDAESPRRERHIMLKAAPAGSALGIGCLGSGAFARAVLLPLLKKNPMLDPRILCSAGGLSAADTGAKLGFASVTTDEDEVINDPAVKAVFIITRHHLHAGQVIKAIRAGKHVFVEKPLALREEEIHEIEAALMSMAEPRPLLMVGFNRRFSPSAIKAREVFAEVSAPLTIGIRMNAGAIPADTWIQDDDAGGGRIIGEACHAIDLACFLAGSPPVRVFAESVGGAFAPAVTDDQCFITLRHLNGSVSSIAYLAGGDKAYPKERVEIFGAGRIAVIEDFKETVTVINGKIKKTGAMKQDKGHRAEVEAFARALLKGGEQPIPWTDLRAESLAAILAVRSIREGMPLDIP
ncbi:MAG TPA: bi-domain-containing oxidoreductase [bacterium]|nr:bi-domain-containing oxidoreductase [bacterium]